jgi:Amt family ammonium transporter
MLAWIGWDLIYKDKPSLIGTVNGMITGLVGITPAAGYVNGYGAIIIGLVATTVVWMSIRYLSRVWPFRVVDDTLGVIYTHGIAGLVGGLLVGLLSDPNMNIYHGLTNFTGLFQPSGTATLLRWQAETALWVIVFSGIVTFVLLKLVGLVISLRATDEELEIGDHAIHGHEVYPADVASLGTFGTTPPLQPASPA